MSTTCHGFQLGYFLIHWPNFTSWLWSVSIVLTSQPWPVEVAMVDPVQGETRFGQFSTLITWSKYRPGSSQGLPPTSTIIPPRQADISSPKRLVGIDDYFVRTQSEHIIRYGVSPGGGRDWCWQDWGVQSNERNFRVHDGKVIWKTKWCSSSNLYFSISPRAEFVTTICQIAGDHLWSSSAEEFFSQASKDGNIIKGRWQ